MEEDTMYLDLENLTDLEITIYSFKDLVFPVGFDTDPYWENVNARIKVAHVRYVLGSFIRKEINTFFPVWLLPHELQGTRSERLINAEVELWIYTLRLISSLDNKYFAFNLRVHPVTYLAELAKEFSLILPNFSRKTIIGDLKLTEFRRVVQTQNRNIKEFKNPFSSMNPYTYELINKAIECERTLVESPKEEWEEMIRSREKLTTVLREGGLSDIEKPEHRGKWTRSKSKRCKSR